DSVHDQTQRSRRPTGSVPLQLNQHEGVAGKQRRPKLDLATAADPSIPEPREIGLVAGQAQTVQRQGLTVWLETGSAPKTHSRLRRSAQPRRPTRGSSRPTGGPLASLLRPGRSWEMSHEVSSGGWKKERQRPLTTR